MVSAKEELEIIERFMNMGYGQQVQYVIELKKRIEEESQHKQEVAEIKKQEKKMRAEARKRGKTHKIK